MAVVECILRGLREATISDELAEEVRQAYEAFARAEPGAATDAAKKALAESRARLFLAERRAHQKRTMLMQTVSDQENVALVQQHPRGAAVGAMARLTRDVTDAAGYANVEKTSVGLLHSWQAQWADALSAMRSRALGFAQDTKLVEDVLLELHGKATGNTAAAAFAKTWGEIAEQARSLFNRAGGDIRFRPDWGSPQFHDRRAIVHAGREEWAKFIAPLLAPDRMIEKATGLPISPESLGDILTKVYNDIATDGIGQTHGTGAMKNRHLESRFLVFKDADAWLTYQRRFGEKDLHAGLTGHLQKMANEVAQMQVLGPNPEAGYKVIREAAQADLAAHPRLGADKADVGEARVLQMDHVWDVVAGRANHPASLSRAEFFAGTRNLLVSSKLGAAFLSSLSDLVFIRQTAAFNRLPVIKIARRYLEQMTPGNEADRILAVKIGLGAQTWTTRALAASRLTGEGVTAAGMWSRSTAMASEAVMRASLLSASTDAGRKAFGLEFMGELGGYAARTLDELAEANPALARTFQRYGFTADDWDRLRQIPTLDYKGARYVSVENIMRAERIGVGRRTDLAAKLMAMVDSEADFAVPMPDARVRGHLLQGTRPGTAKGEFMRGFVMFRSFPVTVLYSHLARGLYQDSPMARGKYLATMVLATTAMGAVAYQAKQIARGENPVPWDANLVGAAFMQGGGAGIFGDFLMAGAGTRYGNSLTATLLGPMWGTGFEDMNTVTLGVLGKAARGQQTNLGRDGVRVMSRYMPGSSLWYTRAALDRMVFDQLYAAIDPRGARQSFRRREAHARDRGTDYFYRPGQMLPDRPPALIGAN